MEKPYYVLLTGGKNNAGDFLIKKRAIELLSKLRPDREIVDVDAWKEFDDNKLQLYNNSQAIILTGGPSLRHNMYPDIYKALGEIRKIDKPILTLGVGWRAFPGDWIQTQNYILSEQTVALLDRIEASGHLSSVRDYHTLNVLQHRGYNSFRMTGCPALYDFKYLGQDFTVDKVEKIGFSLGVSFVKDADHETQMKESILKLKNNSKYNLKIAFHHSLDKRVLQETYKGYDKFYDKHAALATWLDEHNIAYEDISGAADNLINFYENCDMHIGYRVHAHIFMSSINKPSILIAEDGRGRGLKSVLNGLIIESENNASKFANNTLLNKVFKRIPPFSKVNYNNEYLAQELLNQFKYEEATEFERITSSRIMIDRLFHKMESVIKNFP